MNYVLRLAGILCLITAVAGGALAYTNQLTAPLIAAQAVRAQQAALEAVVPGATSFEAQPEQLAAAQARDPALRDVVELHSASGPEGWAGIAATARVTGYGGPVKVTVGISAGGRVTGVRIISAPGETPGLGARIRDAAFLGQFLDRDAARPLALVRDAPDQAHEVQAIAAATISSAAVLRAVNAAASLSRALAGDGAERLAALKLEGARSLFPGADRIVADPDTVAALQAAHPGLEGATDLYRAMAGDAVLGVAVAGRGQGYDGIITVVTGFDPGGRLVGVAVVDMPGETVGLGTLIGAPGFTAQFRGQPASPVTLVTRTPAAGSEVQAVASATKSSQGAVDAVNHAIRLFGKLPR